MHSAANKTRQLSTVLAGQVKAGDQVCWGLATDMQAEGREAACLDAHAISEHVLAH